jgi:hypothetical protein
MVDGLSVNCPASRCSAGPQQAPRIRNDIICNSLVLGSFITGEVDEGQHRGAIKNGSRAGPWVGYWSNGRVEFKGAFKNGQREGPCLWYNENDTKDENLSGIYRNYVKVFD